MAGTLHGAGPSRSTLWRQARSDVMESPSLSQNDEENDVLDIGLDDGAGCSDVECDLDLLASSCEIDNDFCIGWRWLQSDSEYESETDDYPSTDEVNGSLKYKLGEWSVAYNITQSALKSLLELLRKYHPSLPRDPRTLLKTPTSHNLRSINGGKYCHIGLAQGIASLVLKSNVAFLCDRLEIQINVDGIPLFKSSSVSLWPILCSVKNIGNKDPCVVGVFCGKEKPGSASEFLKDFISEAQNILENGLVIADKMFTVAIHSFVCDAPARAFLKGIKCHSGYASCEKCTVHGEYEGKVIFPFFDVPLRTDDSFNAQLDEDHHTEPFCPLSSLSVGCVSQFGLEYMHLACLGLMRRMLMYWKGPIGPLHVRLGRKSCCDLSLRLVCFASYCPVEFARKPRSVDDVLRWKATEFRQFLMYSGPFVLSGLLPELLYNHFMLVFVAFRILASKDLAVTCNDYANELLRKFVHDAESLYGKEIMVYNIHSLIHLAADVKVLGCLDDFSAFVFENKLGQLKKLIRSPRQPLQQLVRRLDEMQSFEVTSSCSSSLGPQAKIEHWSGPLPPLYSNCRQFRRLETAQWTLSLKAGDNCILVQDGSPAIVKNIVKQNNDISIVCARFANVSEAFSYPLPSSKLSICSVENECSRLFAISVDDVRCKCVCWPVISKPDSLILVPLLHRN